MTGRAHGLASESAQHHAVLNLILVFLHHSEELVDAHTVVRITVFFRWQSVPEPVFLLLRQFVVRLEDREFVRFRPADEFLEPHAHLLATPAHHATVVEAERSVRNHEFLVDADDASEALAGRAGAQRRIEGKHIVGRFLKLHAVGFKSGGEVVADVAWREDESAGAVALIEGGFGRVEETADVILLVAYRCAVDNEIDFPVLLFQHLDEVFTARLQKLLVSRILIACFRRIHISSFQEILYSDEFTLLHDAGITLLHVHLQLLSEGAVFDDMDWGEDYELGALGILSGAGKDILRGMPFHFLSADRRIGFSDACEEQSQVFVNLRAGAHGGAWVAGYHLLLDGDGWRQSLDEITLWLGHSSQELTGVGRQRLHVAALALGV